MKKKILILLTGGTIAGKVAKSAITEYVDADPKSFMSIIEHAKSILEESWKLQIEPTIEEILNIDSSDVQPKHWTALVEKIAGTYDEYDAFIILHGTNTMGYTGAALSFAFENINKPIILTGAQVPLGYLGSDAVTNIVNTMRIAAWEYHQIKGVIAVFGSKIISGVRIKKGTDFDYDPFRSFVSNSIGQIGRTIRINETMLAKHVAYLSKWKPIAVQSRALSVKKDFDVSGIVSLTEFPGMPIELFKSLVENEGKKAFILRAYGAGDPGMYLMDAFEYLKQKKIPIVVTTQAPEGTASFQVNESGKMLKEKDLAIPAFDMSIESMTTKLAWLLAQKLDYEQIKQMMVTDLHGEINVESVYE